MDISKWPPSAISINYTFRITQYSELAALTAMICDYCTTFSEEVDLIWSSSISIMKLAFILNRYFTLIVSVIYTSTFFRNSFSIESSDTFCKLSVFLPAWTGFYSCAFAEVILMLRVNALYLGNRRVMVAMAVGYFVAMSMGGIFIMTLYPAMETVIPKIESRDSYKIPLACFPYHYWTTSWDGYLFWVPIIVFEVFLCSLLIVRAVRAYRVGGGLCFRMFHITRILIRDSLLYYVAILASYVSTTIYWGHLAKKESDFLYSGHSSYDEDSGISAPVTFSLAVFQIPLAFTTAISFIVTNRLVLNLRREDAKQCEIFNGLTHGEYNVHPDWNDQATRTRRARTELMDQ